MAMCLLTRRLPRFRQPTTASSEAQEAAQEAGLISRTWFHTGDTSSGNLGQQLGDVFRRVWSDPTVSTSSSAGRRCRAGTAPPSSAPACTRTRTQPGQPRRSRSGYTVHRSQLHDFKSFIRNPPCLLPPTTCPPLVTTSPSRSDSLARSAQCRGS